MKILLIEDDKILSDTLKKSLKNAGFSVDQFYDGEVAQKYIQINRGTYDLIILDIIIPFIHGDDVCRNVRNFGVQVPILILTGKDNVEYKIELLNSGADDYLTKPFSVDELIARVHALLRRPQVVIENEIKVDDIVLNPTTRKVMKNGKEIKLTLKEFCILEYLMINANKVIMRDQILDHVWDFNFSSLSISNVIDLYIHNIRKKLFFKKTNTLETVRGIGYRLNI